MATESAQLRNAPGQLWQFPIFLLGIAAMVGVWYLRPIWTLSAADRYQRELTLLKQATDKSPPDPSQVQTLLRKVQSSEPPESLSAQTQYLVGSAYMILAETAANSEDALEQWRMARRYLETAGELGLSDADRVRHQFRLAKTWAMTGVEPAKVIEILSKSLTGSDDVADGNRVLAEMYLKLDPPDPKKARDCLKEYLSRVLPARTEAQSRILNTARLRLGECYLSLNEPEESRKILERIGQDAPTEILVAAKLMLARSHQAEDDWRQAALAWEHARDVKDLTSVQKATILFHLADCYLHVNRKSEALAALEQLRKIGGTEAQASSLKLAELQMNDVAQREPVTQILENALPRTMTAEQYQSTLLPITEARTIYEQATQAFRLAGAFSQSIRVAQAYGRIAEKGRDKELAAEALEAWGLQLLDPATPEGNEGRARLVETGTQKMREAAVEWSQLGTVKKTAVERGDALRRAANLYLKIGDYQQALETLDLFNLRVADYPPERVAEVWLQKGEAYLALDNREQARLCFQNAVQLGEQYPSTALLQARIRQSEILLKSNEPRSVLRALGDLEKVLADPEVAKEKTAHELALTLMADAIFRQGEFAKAETRYRMVLDSYPDSLRSTYARFQLGLCYWRQAEQEAKRCVVCDKARAEPNLSASRKVEVETQYADSYKRYMELLNKAYEPFKAVSASLGLVKQKLSREDSDILRRSSLLAADCAFYMGNYPECLARYDALTQQYTGTVVELEAYRAMVQCQRHLHNSTRVNDLLAQVRSAYARMMDSAFDGTAEVQTRDYWIKWLEANDPKK